AARYTLPLSLSRLLETGRALIGRVPQHGPDRTLIPSGLAGPSAKTRRGQPAGDGAERFPLFRVAAEDLAHDGGLVLNDLIPCRQPRALSYVANADRCAGHGADRPALALPLL